jgi:hypothetical protein
MPQFDARGLGMAQQTVIHRTEGRETPIKVITCPDDLTEFAEEQSQSESRKIFEFPGVLIVEEVLDEATLEGLREGLTDQRRKFKDKFNQGLPASDTFRAAAQQAAARVREATENLFGYRLPEKGNRSYRPMITENEPLHLDTYAIECGRTPLMSVFNFDVVPRLWNVGPSLREICRDCPDDIREMIAQRAPGESLNMRLRDAGLKGIGPLREGTAVNRIEFAPGSVWYANPKALSHQVIYGGGAQFETWTIDEPECSCPKCVVEMAGLSFPALSPSETVVALR